MRTPNRREAIPVVARRLGLNESVLRRWVEEVSASTRSPHPHSGVRRDDCVRRIEHLERENEVLRAAAHFLKREFDSPPHK
ncbi:transposase [Micromonospora marina]|uniref:transposase n=1 Tax=Micromonospora marina TaxID=307120 RepID=UPI003456224B